MSGLRLMLAAQRAARTAAERERWPRERLESFQRERLAVLLAHARRHCALHRERLAGIPDDAPVEALPVLTKDELMARYDDALAVPGLTLGRLEAHLDGPDAGTLLDGRFRVMATGGSTGRRGVFAYDTDEWTDMMSAFARQSAITGLRPTLPRRRIALLVATTPTHMTCHMARTVDVGIHRVLPLDPRRPIAEHRAALEAFDPHVLSGYPSVVALAAQETLAGRLAIRPELVSTSSEVRTAEMADVIRAAWQPRLHDLYGITEGGIAGVDCEAHVGMHLFEDRLIVEDDGDRILVTALESRTLPIIRYAIDDLVAIDRTPCACGRTLARVGAVDGRADELLDLAAPGGGRVRVHPLALRSPMARIAGVAEYQVQAAPDALTILVVPRDGAGPELADEVAARVVSALRDAGAGDVHVGAELVTALQRGDGAGKRRLVVPAQPRLSVP